MTEQARQENGEKPGKPDRWWQLMLWAALCFGIAGYLFWDLSRFEETGGVRHVYWLVALLYNTLGKWGCVGLFALGGVFFGVLGVKGLVGRDKKA